MPYFLEQLISFVIASALGGLGVIINYSNKVRNDVQIKLKWFLAELVTGMLFAGSFYSLFPEGGWKVPAAVFVGYFSHTILDIAETKMPDIIRNRIEAYFGVKKVPLEVQEIQEPMQEPGQELAPVKKRKAKIKK